MSSVTASDPAGKAVITPSCNKPSHSVNVVSNNLLLNKSQTTSGVMSADKPPESGDMSGIGDNNSVDASGSPSRSECVINNTQVTSGKAHKTPANNIMPSQPQNNTTQADADQTNCLSGEVAQECCGLSVDSSQAVPSANITENNKCGLLKQSQTTPGNVNVKEQNTTERADTQHSEVSSSRKPEVSKCDIVTHTIKNPSNVCSVKVEKTSSTSHSVTSVSKDITEGVTETTKTIVKDTDSIKVTSVTTNGPNLCSAKKTVVVSGGDSKGPTPSTSSTARPVGRTVRSGSLAIMPRTEQYQKHPLLQNRSDSGMSEIELFLKEKSGFVKRDPEPPRMRLEPRGAQIERHALLVKTSSGMSELEQYLLEKDREALYSSSRGSVSGPQALLQPRYEQYEKNMLLERDESGKSPLDLYLEEKEIEFRGKCSANHVCKNIKCTNCRTSTSNASDIITPKSSIKRVHFKQQSLETERGASEINKCRQKGRRNRSQSLGDVVEDTGADKRRGWKMRSLRSFKRKEDKCFNQPRIVKNIVTKVEEKPENATEIKVEKKENKNDEGDKNTINDKSKTVEKTKNKAKRTNKKTCVIS